MAISKLRIILPFLASALGPHLVLAQVEDELPVTVVRGLGTLAFAIVLITITIALVSFIFWLMMVIHAATNEVPDKTLWLVILVASLFFGVWFISAVIYYFAVKKKFDAAQTAAPSAKIGTAQKSRSKTRSRKS